MPTWTKKTAAEAAAKIASEKRWPTINTSYALIYKFIFNFLVAGRASKKDMFPAFDSRPVKL